MRGQTYRLRAGDLSWQQVDDEVVVLDLAGSVYLALNGAAALLWQHLSDASDRGVTEAVLADALVDAYAIERDQATADVQAFVSDAASRGLLEPLDP